MLRNPFSSASLRTPRVPLILNASTQHALTSYCDNLHRNMTATSPPTSPLPKRQKHNPTAATATLSINSAIMTNFPEQTPLQIKKLSDKARLPTRGSAFSAGYDLYAAKDTVVPARGKVLVHTDISMAVPAGTCLYPSLPPDNQHRKIF
jgi:hypothetical protein